MLSLYLSLTHKRGGTDENERRDGETGRRERIERKKGAWMDREEKKRKRGKAGDRERDGKGEASKVRLRGHVERRDGKAIFNV